MATKLQTARLPVAGPSIVLLTSAAILRQRCGARPRSSARGAHGYSGTLPGVITVVPWHRGTMAAAWVVSWYSHRTKCGSFPLMSSTPNVDPGTFLNTLLSQLIGLCADLREDTHTHTHHRPKMMSLTGRARDDTHQNPKRAVSAVRSNAFAAHSPPSASQAGQARSHRISPTCWLGTSGVGHLLQPDGFSRSTERSSTTHTVPPKFPCAFMRQGPPVS